MLLILSVLELAAAAVTTRPPKLWPTRWMRCTCGARFVDQLCHAILADGSGAGFHLVVSGEVQDVHGRGFEAGEKRRSGRPRRLRRAGQFPLQAAMKRCLPRRRRLPHRDRPQSTFRFFINSLPSSLKKLSDASSLFAADGSRTTGSCSTNSRRADAFPRCPEAALSLRPVSACCAGSANSFFIGSSLSSTRFKRFFVRRGETCRAPRAARRTRSGNQLVEFLRRPDHADDGRSSARKISPAARNR